MLIIVKYRYIETFLEFFFDLGLRVFGGQVEILRLLTRCFGSFGLLGGFGDLFPAVADLDDE